MSRQIAPPYKREDQVVVPTDTCEDCLREVRYPGRMYQVAEPPREICATCWEAPRMAPSVLHFRIEGRL